MIHRTHFHSPLSADSKNLRRKRLRGGPREPVEVNLLPSSGNPESGAWALGYVIWAILEYLISTDNCEAFTSSAVATAQLIG